MRRKLITRIRSLGPFLLERLDEPTTWQGIGFLCALFGSKFAGLDWGQGAALGGFISALIKTFTKG